MPQTQPGRLICQGQTAGDPNRTYTIRAPFDGTVVNVYTKAGHPAKRGDAFIEIFSSDLFESRIIYASKKAAWVRSTEALTAMKDAARRGRGDMPRQVDAENEVEKTRLEFQAAEDKLRVLFGLSDEDIRIGGRETATLGRLMIHSPADGLVTSLEAVAGNRYDKTALLMTVTRMDVVWVLAELPEADQPRLLYGTTVEVEFPYLYMRVQSKVDYVSSKVDPQAHTIQVRTSIPNPLGSFILGMRVRIGFEIPPRPGQTVIPTRAVAAVRGSHYVFVRLPGPAERYERRQIRISSVQSDYVVISEGVRPGEKVLSNPPTFSARDRRFQARREYLVGLVRELDDLRKQELHPAQEAPTHPPKN